MHDPGVDETPLPERSACRTTSPERRMCSVRERDERFLGALEPLGAAGDVGTTYGSPGVDGAGPHLCTVTHVPGTSPMSPERSVTHESGHNRSHPGAGGSGTGS